MIDFNQRQRDLESSKKVIGSHIISGTTMYGQMHFARDIPEELRDIWRWFYAEQKTFTKLVLLSTNSVDITFQKIEE